MIAAVWALFAAAVAMPPVAPPPPPAFPKPTVHTLSGGGEVWVVRRPELPLVRVEVSLRGGQRDAADPLALQLAGALLDEGSRGWPGPAWAEAAGELGAETSVGVGAWRAWADVEVAAGDEAAGLALLADALRRPRLAGRAVRRIRRGWVESGASAWRSTDTVVQTALARALLPADHPLGRVWGPRDYQRLTRGRVRRAWRKATRRGGLAVVVVGDVTPDRILPLLEEHLGWLAGAPPPPPLPAPDRAEPLRILVDQPGVTQARVVVSMPAPGASSPDLPAAGLVTHGLCEAFTSRLNRALREEEGWTYGVACRLDARPGFGRLVIEIPVEAALVGEVMVRTEALLAAAAEDLPTASELRAARNTRLVEAARALTRNAEVAWRLGRHLAHARPPTAEQAWLDALSDVTVADAREAAGSMLAADQQLWLVVGDAQRTEPALAAAGRPPDKVWTAERVTASRRSHRSGPTDAP